jgi:glycosyltransferase involved in cell wall biosynthesis
LNLNLKSFGLVEEVRVSIITPSFNRADLISQTLDSVAAQSLPDWEQIIVDDGSTDNTKEVINSYRAKDSRFRLYDRAREPKGACACRNIAVDYSVGEYLIFLDTDDLLEPFCLEQRVKVMEQNPDLDFAIFPGTLFENEPHDLGLLWNTDKPIDQLTRQFHQDAIAQGTGVIWRKSAFNRVGRWNEQLTIWQDIDLFFRAYIQDYRYKVFFDLPADLHNRRNQASLSRKGFFAPEKIASRIVVIKNAVELLKAHDKKKYLREARYMVAEIVSGLVRSGNARGARELIHWASQQNILTQAEVRSLKRLVFYYKTRLASLPGFKNAVRREESKFKATSTLGTIQYDPARIGANLILSGGLI